MSKLVSFKKQLGKPIVIALGFFDCIHIGHRKLIDRVKVLAKELACHTAIFTYDNNPMTYFKDEKLVYNFSERVELLKKLNMDYIIYEHFDEEHKNVEAIDFLEKLFKYFNVKAVVCGLDYSFGKDAKGNIDLLKTFTKANKIPFEVISTEKFDEKKASSSLIRELIFKGQIEKANECLGDFYRISGRVVRGKGLGQKLGFPTMNISIDKDKILPKLAVYGAHIEIGEKVYKCIANLGGRPTYNEDEIILEVFVNDLSGDFYGKEITVYFDKYLREIKKFESSQELINQLEKDKDFFK